MNYQVGSHVDLSHLNSPKQLERRAISERVKAQADKLIPGTRVSFMKLASGLMVMSIVEPNMVLSVGS